MISDLTVGPTLIELTFYFVGRLIILMISLGHCRCDPWRVAGTSNLKEARNNFSKRRKTEFRITTYATTVVGGIICLGALGVVIGLMICMLANPCLLSSG